MKNTPNPLPSPPHDSKLLLEHASDSVLVSGSSQGVPLELYSSDDLAGMSKALGLVGKLTGDSSENRLGDQLAQRVFDWSISLSDTLVTYSSSALSNDCLFTLNEIRRIFHSDQGHLVVELSRLEKGKHQTQILSGELGDEDKVWLFQSLIQIFDLYPNGVAKVSDQSDFQKPPTAGFKLVEEAGGQRVEIEHVQEFLFQRIIPLLIGLVVISLMGVTLLGGQGGGEGLLADLMALARDHPVWSKLARFVVIAVIVYFGFRIARLALGTLRIKVDQHSFEIKKGILGVGFPRSVSRSQITGLKQSSWTEKQKNESTENLETVQYWKLELEGAQSITLLTNDADPRDTDWLGQYLSDWFDVPFAKEDV